MKAFKFNAKISENGTIQLPYTPSLFNKEVELIVVPKQDMESIKMTAKEFIEKWAGFLNSSDTDSSKFNYLSEKYK